MTTFNWTISQLERRASDGFVTTVHYRVVATDGDDAASIYSTLGYQDIPEEAFVPFEELTEEVVVGWVKATLGESNVEAALQSQIDAIKTPASLTGLPWSAGE